MQNSDADDKLVFVCKYVFTTYKSDVGIAEISRSEVTVILL